MSSAGPELDDQTPAWREELQRLRHGLAQPQKWISSMYFYDDAGARLFDRITEQPEYYLTRTELAIMRRHVGEMAEKIGPEAMVIEPGSGAGEKIRLLLDALALPVAYVPIEIARHYLEASSGALAGDFPDIEILPVWGDFTQPLDIPTPARKVLRRVIYFPGSTLGNFEPRDAAALLENFAGMVGEGGVALVGVDLAKEAQVIEPAYNDAAGVTAAFNLNMLAHLNRRFHADFKLADFEHLAFYNERESRIEMHLRSCCRQTVHLDGEAVEFESGETIHTESSYKYTDERFAELAAAAGFRLIETWKDAVAMFSVRYLMRQSAGE
ncbi:MAG: L-histidine N(alpha)-methyltransferase [Gammaproteobacteria bacterium]